MPYINKFLEHLKNNHYAKTTIIFYHQILTKADIYFNSVSLTDERCIVEKDIVVYLEYLKNHDYTNLFCYRVLLVLRKYYKFLVENKIILMNPTSDIAKPKIEKSISKALDIEEIKEILDKIDITKPYGIRLRMIIEVFYSTGIRPMEFINLKISDINFDSKSIFIYQGKMKKDRIVPIGDTAIYWIKKYINEVRDKCVKDKERDSNYLLALMNQNGKKIEYGSLRTIIYKSINKYNFKKFRMYSLRTSYATHLLQNGLNILYIKELLGHSNLISTCVYLNINVKNLLHELKLKHPRYNIDRQKEIKRNYFYKIIDNYNDYLTGKIHGNSSQGCYLSQAISFIKFIEANYPLLDDIKDLTIEIIGSYKEYLKECKNADGNILSNDRQFSIITNIKHFLWFLIDFKYINYCPEIRQIKKNWSTK